MSKGERVCAEAEPKLPASVFTQPAYENRVFMYVCPSTVTTTYLILGVLLDLPVLPVLYRHPIHGVPCTCWDELVVFTLWKHVYGKRTESGLCRDFLSGRCSKVKKGALSAFKSHAHQIAPPPKPSTRMDRMRGFLEGSVGI